MGHDVPGRGVVKLEDVVDHFLLAFLNEAHFAAGVHQHPDFFLRHRVRRLFGVRPQHPGHPRGEPPDGPGNGHKEPQRPGIQLRRRVPEMLAVPRPQELGNLHPHAEVGEGQHDCADGRAPQQQRMGKAPRLRLRAGDPDKLPVKRFRRQKQPGNLRQNRADHRRGPDPVRDVRDRQTSGEPLGPMVAVFRPLLEIGVIHADHRRRAGGEEAAAHQKQQRKHKIP